LALPVIY